MTRKTRMPGRRSIALLLALAILSHIQILRIGFLHDDLFNFLHTFRFSGILAGLREAWSAHPGDEYYRPVVESVFGFTFAAFGATPLWFRLFDLCLHGGATLLASVLILRMTRNPGAALVVGALLAVHPLPGRAVCWTSDRYVVMGAVFTFLAALCFLDWRRRGKGRHLALALLFQGLGLLSKESAAAVPAALLVIDLFWGAGRKRNRLGIRVRNLIQGIWPFVLLNLIYLAFRYWAFGDLGGYRDPEDGTIFLPFGPASMARESLLDLPLLCFFPLNHRLITGTWIGIVTAVFALLLGWLLLESCLDRTRRKEPILWHALGGLILGYALLLPSLPYFYLSRDLLKAYHIYPVALGFGLAAWAVFRSRRGRLPFCLLLAVYVIVGQVHVQSWIRATRMVDAFKEWVVRLEPPLDSTSPIWVAGMPQNWRGALVIEPNQMKKSLEVLLDRRFEFSRGLGYPWCTATYEQVLDSVQQGGRFLHWDAETLLGVDRTGALKEAAGLESLVLMEDAKAGQGSWKAEGEAIPGNRPGTWILKGRKGRLRWTGPPLIPPGMPECRSGCD